MKPRKISNLFAKAKNGGDITLAALGGSITQGMSATSVDNCWLNLTGQWFKENFPLSKITVVNLGIGATGSDIGVFRFDSQMARCSPDMVFIEFSVNDVTIGNAPETFEGLIRKILKYPGSPAVFVVITCDALLRNAEEVHLPLVQHYHLPVANMKNELTCNSRGDILNTFYANDGIHPNDEGHKLIAGLIIKSMGEIQQDFVGIPKPLTSDVYENTCLLNAENAKLLKNDGWCVGGAKGICYGLWWESSGAGNVLELETVECHGVGILVHSYSRARISIDGEADREINAIVSGTPIIMEPVFMLSTDLDCKKHKLKITSTDAGFILKAILLVGTKNVRDPDFLEISNSVTVY